MLETSTKIHLVRNYEEHLYSQTSNWSNSIRFIHPSRPKKRLVCQETSTPIVLCTLLHQASGCCADRSMFSKCKDKWYIGCKRYKYSIVVKVVSHKDKLSGEDLDLTTCKATDQATKSDVGHPSYINSGTIASFMHFSLRQQQTRYLGLVTWCSPS